MAVNLIKKDLLLVKKYLFFMFLFSAAAPAYLSSSLEIPGSGMLCFSLTVLYVEFILFSYVSRAEDKYKGAAYLCAAPYTRTVFVCAKYLFLLTVFLLYILIQMMVSIVLPAYAPKITLVGLMLAFMILSVFFGVLLPLQFRFGYDKTRLISLVVIFLLPFSLPALVELLQEHASFFNFIQSVPRAAKLGIPALAGIAAGLVSMYVSIKIYSNKDL